MSGPLLLLCCIGLSAAASYFLKLGAMGSGRTGLLDIAADPMTWVGAFCYASTFALYAMALQKVPLSLAQPVITGGASVVTAIVALVLLRESMGLANWLGLVLVCVGVYLLFQGRA